jgi:hypothetical protein
MFLLYHSEGCNICGGLFHKCYINDLHTTTCSGMLGHRTQEEERATEVVAAAARGGVDDHGFGDG